jgi:ATP-dependent Lon protease
MAEPDGGAPHIINQGDEPVPVVVHPQGEDAPAGDQPPRIEGESAVLAIRNLVIFPGTLVPLAVARDKSRKLVDDCLPQQKPLLVVCQKDPDVDDPGPDDLYEVGTAVTVLKVLRLEDGNQGVVVHGLQRARVQRWTAEEPYLRAEVTALDEQGKTDTRTEALVVNARTIAARVIELSPNMPNEALTVLENIDEPGPLADFLASNLPMDAPTRQQLLEELDINRRLRSVVEQLQRQSEILELSDKIQTQVKANIDKSQREYYLQEQLKAIREELGELDERTAEVEQIKRCIADADMPENVQAEADRELDRLSKVPAASAEYNVLRTYLDVLCELPWSRSTTDRLDVNRARRILNEDHYDLDKVKRRILEYLAVRKLAPASRGPILCFVGPPGVGKTSLGQSIARALGRKFIRMSLGGMRDEAELRGHRRTYIGALPGRIIQELRKAGSNNPVFMLDELDKVGADFRGDPTSALLEILDPAQNGSFQDHYLGVPFDLTKVMFIATANYMAPVPPALRDRMEVIELPGYTKTQKLQIARTYLVPRQLEANGLTASQAKWKDEAIERIIASYTRESGVRELERQIGAVCRTLAAQIAAGKAKSRTINKRYVPHALGPAQYQSEVALRTSEPGVATGLAFTPTGGELIFVEATGYPGKGQLQLTGQIGDVMRESAQAAMSIVKTRANQLDLDPREIAASDLHIHVPAGAIPKDGPSAGVAILTALVSLLVDEPVRSDVAMTGEVTLRGLVLPVGGIKEKVLAARQAGIRTIVLPKRNEKDLVDVPEDARKSLEFVFASTVDEALRATLENGADVIPPSRRSRGKTKRSGKK